MDLTRLAVDAGQFINRAVQYTGESLGQADKTELDPGLEELLARADATKTWTDKIISETEVLLQPNPGARLEDRLYGSLDWAVPPRPRANEALGDQMIQAGMEFGTNTPYGMALLRCGEAQKQLGEAEKKFVQSTNIHFLNPLRRFSEGEYKAIQDERRMLVNKRLDLDIAIARVRKAHEADREARNLNANPLDDDYIAHVSYMFSFLRVKWLKIWAQEISQAEMEQRICQSLFDRQSQITRQVAEGISNIHINHMRTLTDFVEAQACYFDQCHQHAKDLQKQLASIPAVLCSNNWQSAVNEPSTSNHVANEPVGLNHVTPLPVIVHQLPEFNQDSWTVNPADSSVNTQPPNQTNNNNNNSLFTIGQATTSCSAGDHHICTSNLDGNPTDQMSALTRSNGADGLTTTTPSPPSEPQTAGTATSETVTTADMDLESSTTNGTAEETQATNGMANELPTINAEDVRESSMDSQAGVQ
ncbi:endophilin-B1-like [Acanthopagrus schlegelii]